MRKLTIDEVKSKIKEVHGDTITLDESTYVNTNTKCRFIDKDYGEWHTMLRDVIYKKCHHPLRGEEIKRTKRTQSIDIIEKKLKIAHNGTGTVSLDKNTYVNVNTKCKFIDKEFGEWWALPANVIYKKRNHPKRAKLMFAETNLKKYGAIYPAQTKEIQDKMKKTNLERYGVEYLSHNQEIALKQAKAQNNSYILFHWKTGKEIVCQASYEKKVVEYLNKNKVNFRWQPKIFKMPCGKTYRPDLYLFSTKKWIEIKGYFRDDAKEKWNWFHKEKPNSELWGKTKLKKLGIL